MKRSIVIAITGASGAIYATRTLAALLERGCHIELVVSDYGRRLLRDELGDAAAVDKLMDYLAATYGEGVRAGTYTLHSNKDLGAKIASGSQDCEAMVIVPCSMKTLAGVAHGLSRNLVERAADVMLKERRPLIIVPRETPMSLPQLKNMVLCAEAGAMIMPAMPAFYQMPQDARRPRRLHGRKDPRRARLQARAVSGVEGMTGPDKTPSRIAGMFDAIAPRYDLLNHVLSAGLDRRWRDRAVDALRLADRAPASSTCAPGPPTWRSRPSGECHGASVVGVDFAGAMLRLGLVQDHRRLASTAPSASSAATPRASLSGRATCDAATIAFGIRNVSEPERALAEIARVLRPGGRLAILEFGQPAIPGIRIALLLVLPLRAASRSAAWSRSTTAPIPTCPASVGTFPPPQEFAGIIAQQGFSNVRAVPLTFGIVYLYIAEKS